MDFILDQILFSSSNVRSASFIAPTGTLRRYRLRDDVTPILTPREMGELIKASSQVSYLFRKFLPKLGDLRYFYLDFDDLQGLIFPIPDLNVLLVMLEKSEPEVPRIVAFILRLLEHEGMIHAK